jgi:hypothetical protein
VKPAGRLRNSEIVRRASRVSRVRSTALIVAKAATASPVKRLLTETPSSASRPWPSECIASIAAASPGRFAT